MAALKPKSRKKVSETQQRHHAARHAWSASTNSSRITEETYVGQIQPRLLAVTISALASTLGVSIFYADGNRIRGTGRDWQNSLELRRP